MIQLQITAIMIDVKTGSLAYYCITGITEISNLIISAKFTLKLQWATVKWDLFKEVGFLLFQRKCKTKSFTVYKHTWAKINHGENNSECI